MILLAPSCSRCSFPAPTGSVASSEIDTVREITTDSRELSEAARFIEIGLEEPPKEARLAHEEDGEPVDRRAFVVIRDKGPGETYRGVVSLDEEAMVSWEHLPDTQPRMIDGCSHGRFPLSFCPKAPHSSRIGV